MRDPIDRERRILTSLLLACRRFFSKYSNVQAQHVDLQVSFGTGQHFWTNLFPTELQQKHAGEIKRFKWAIRFMRWTELFWALIPLKVSLKMLFFSDEFMNHMIYPALALFLGTGNATPDLPSIMMERLYTSPTYGMWYQVDDKCLSSNLPPMVVFPEERAFYETWRKALVERGVNVRLRTEVDAILERSNKGVRVLTRPRRPTPDDHVPNATDQDLPQTEETYDEIVLCCLADTAQRLLGKTARWIDNRVLGATTWSDDITVTHNDTEYMKKWYTVDFDEDLAVSKINGRDDSDRVQRGRTDFNPMYLIKNTPKDPRKLEMCMCCVQWQTHVLLSRFGSLRLRLQQLPVPAQGGQEAIRRPRLPDDLPKQEARRHMVAARDRKGQDHPRGLVAPALPLLDTLRIRRTLDVAAQRQEAHNLRGGLDTRQCPRTGYHQRHGGCLYPWCRIPRGTREGRLCYALLQTYVLPETLAYFPPSD